MPPRPRTPRSRVGTPRRPRVAGLTPAAQRTDDAERADARADAPVRVDDAPRPDAFAEDLLADPAEAEQVSQAKAPAAPDITAQPEPVPADADAELEPAARIDAETERPGRLAALRAQAVPLLAAAFVLFTALAVVAGVADARLRGTPAAENTALVDVGATAEAAGQLSDALETVYSFDFARLDENERAAREVITPEFAAEFDRLFAEVRQRAPEQQAVVSATVTLSAVKELGADRAVLVVFVDQQATRAAADAQSQQLAAAGRLTVTGERVDGRWKVASVVPR
jgi:Mce-associated membrane protein